MRKKSSRTVVGLDLVSVLSIESVLCENRFFAFTNKRTDGNGDVPHFPPTHCAFKFLLTHTSIQRLSMPRLTCCKHMMQRIFPLLLIPLKSVLLGGILENL